MGYAAPLPRVKAGEVVALLARARGLRKLLVCGNTSKGWSARGRAAVEQAARKAGVTLDCPDQWEPGSDSEEEGDGEEESE